MTDIFISTFDVPRMVIDRYEPTSPFGYSMYTLYLESEDYRL